MRELVDLGNRIAIITWEMPWDIIWEDKNRYKQLSYDIYYKIGDDLEAKQKEFEELRYKELHRFVDVKDITFMAAKAKDLKNIKLTKFELNKINLRIKELDKQLETETISIEEFMIDD